MVIKQNDQKKIINYINNSFNESDINLSEYLCTNSEIIISTLDLPFELDHFYYSIGDTNSNEYSQFVDLMKKEINKNYPKSKIVLIHEYGEDILSQSNYGRNIDIGIKKSISKMLTDLKNYSNSSVLYEKFCGEFFKDCGFEKVVVTKSSNDFGVDLIAQLKISNKKLILPNKINILAQVKYYDSQIDTSYLRKLIGDSLFIKFDSNIYTNIAHEPLCLYMIGHLGFTTDAKLFANTNGIQLLDSQTICEYISSLEKPETSLSFQFLRKIYKDTI
ncbi:restriction endonuclease [Bacillus subtilis]|uniref:restriction endonuclease n=1 Tax=Bacillus subtilis TaxID=1423 RepID=UPI003C7CE063